MKFLKDLWQALLSIFSKKPENTWPPASDPLPVPPVDADAYVVTVAPKAAAEAGITYTPYLGLTPYDILTRKFPNGLPVGWDWGVWAQLAGKPDPRATTPMGGSIRDMKDGSALGSPGEVHLVQMQAGETITVLLSRVGGVMLLFAYTAGTSPAGTAPSVTVEINGETKRMSPEGAQWNFNSHGLTPIKLTADSATRFHLVYRAVAFFGSVVDGVKVPYDPARGK